jgi:predicted small metal-binding protein
MRVIDCNDCGATIKAANDEDLLGEVDEHMQAEHSDSEWDSHEMVASQAYDAEDS